jgi:hypothetical protein
MINAAVIDMVREPLVETLLLFSVLITFYLIFKNSRWRYLAASLSTMVRYECVLLIAAAFIIDVLSTKDKKQWLKALAYSALAFIPMGIWVLGTVINWQHQEATYYVKEIGAESGGKIVIGRFIELMWQTQFAPLLMPTPGAGQETAASIMGFNKLLVFGSFVFGTVYGLIRKNWKILALLVFATGYVVIHGVHSVMQPRYSMIVNWIILLVCCFGLKSLWELVNKNNRIPKPIVIMLQAVLLALTFGWLINLSAYLPETAAFSKACRFLPYVGIGAVVSFVIAKAVIFKQKYLWTDIVICSFVCLMLVSNQFTTAQVLGEGNINIEFKYLTDWYDQNAKPGEKIVCTMAGNMAVFDPANTKNFVHYASVVSKTREEFIQKCRDMGIVYVVWDSRIGYFTNDRYYKIWGLDSIADLSLPRSTEALDYVTTIKANERRFVHVFRLKDKAQSRVN